ncbi:MAG: hypothetical protein KF764_13965 [Labilithrix sp.]|nr:hypothetical protein [Labilithrix sp.]
MGDTYTFRALVCAPIPVGHRVAISWFGRKAGFFGGKEERFAHLEDLDTGVVYGEMECFSDLSAIRVEPTPIGLTVRSDLKASERLEGKVVACQVATLGFRDRFIQTTLLIERTSTARGRPET